MGKNSNFYGERDNQCRKLTTKFLKNSMIDNHYYQLFEKTLVNLLQDNLQ